MQLTQFDRMLEEEFGLTCTRQESSHRQYHTKSGKLVPISIHSRRVNPRELRYLKSLIKRALREEQEQVV